MRGLRTDLLGGAVRLDANRQGIVSTRLVRIGGGAEPSLTPLRAIGGVDQSIGGLLEPSVRPSYWPPKCRRAAAATVGALIRLRLPRSSR